MYIYVTPNTQKSSEVLAAKQMSFELFCECVNGKRRGPQFHTESVPCRWHGHREVTPAPGTTSVPLIADCSCHLLTTGETGVQTTHVSQVGRCQTVKALVNYHSKLETDTLPD